MTLFLQPAVGGVRVRAWGPGAGLAVEAAPALLGADDDPAALVPQHPAVAEGARRGRGIRIGRSGAVWEALVPAILEQKITGDEARRTYRALVRAYGEDAPGPPGLRLPPAPETLAALPYHAFHPLGLERRRAELIQARGARGAAAGTPRGRGRGGVTRSGAFGRALPPPTTRSGRSPASGRGRRPRSGSGRSATRTR